MNLNEGQKVLVSNVTCACNRAKQSTTFEHMGINSKQPVQCVACGRDYADYPCVIFPGDKERYVCHHQIQVIK